MKEKAHTLWLRWSDGRWRPTITVSGKATSKTGRQLLGEFRNQHYVSGYWKGHSRILPVGQEPK